MEGILKYRIPNESPQSFSGEFTVVSELSLPMEFMVTTFDLSRKFKFKATANAKRETPPKAPEETGKLNYLHSAESILDELKAGSVDKVVLSRTKFIEGSYDPELLYAALLHAYPNAFVYLISSPLFGTWLGASPELFLRSNGSTKSMISLAGTKTATDQSAWTNKEVNEQAYVTDYLLNELKDLGVDKVQVSGPTETIAGPVKHLKTEVDFTSQIEDSLLIERLHPTPAVCGVPKTGAMRLIQQYETQPRDLYAGLLGVLGSRSTVYVNLRCLRLYENGVMLYIGGGLTHDSDVEKEWEETERKAETMQRILI